MAKQLRVRAVRRKTINEDKLALAYLLLAKAIVEGKSAAGASEAAKSSKPPEPSR